MYATFTCVSFVADFQQSGFVHSAFVLRAEGRLEHSPHHKKHVPRGQLVELLSKALLFSEVEHHWKGDTMTMTCTNQFRLLEPHTCSFDPKFPPPPLPDAQRHHAQPPESAGGPQAEGSLKRKASGTPSVDEAPKEKRARVNGQLEDEVDTGSPSLVESMLLCLRILVNPIQYLLRSSSTSCVEAAGRLSHLNHRSCRDIG